MGPQGALALPLPLKYDIQKTSWLHHPEHSYKASLLPPGLLPKSPKWKVVKSQPRRPVSEAAQETGPEHEALLPHPGRKRREFSLWRRRRAQGGSNIHKGPQEKKKSWKNASLSVSIAFVRWEGASSLPLCPCTSSCPKFLPVLSSSLCCPV